MSGYFLGQDLLWHKLTPEEQQASLMMAGFLPLGAARAVSGKMSGTFNAVDGMPRRTISKGTGEVITKVKYGDQYTRIGRKKVLKPNVEYTSKEGYNYKIDNHGRINSAEGTLKLGDGKRNNYAQKIVGREHREPKDEGGHLIASIFKGSGDLDNLVPMNGNLNKGEWKKLENTWAVALKHGDEVKVKITPIYKVNSQRPESFNIKYKIGDDEWEIKRFDNVPGGRKLDE